jgi:radical SAM protein with 4Fe4S-binding SPASM domain
MDKLYFQWHITNLCNYRCKHCYQDRFDDKEDLDWQGIKKIADTIIRYALENKKRIVINITGGEPFLKKELFLLLDYLEPKTAIEKFVIITNGSLLDEQTIEKLKNCSKLKEIKFSLEAADPLTNDAIRAKGSYAKVFKAIQLLKEKTKISSILMFTAFKSNLKELPLLFNLAKEKGISGIIIERFFPLGRGRNISGELLESDDWYNLNKELLKLDNFSFNLEDLLTYRAFWIRIFPKKIELFGASCNVGKDSFCIMPNADIYPCRRFILKLGNLLENSLDEIINSEILKRIIETRKRGRCADCDIKGCSSCPALSYLLTGDWTKEDFQCWYKRDVSLSL